MLPPSARAAARRKRRAPATLGRSGQALWGAIHTERQLRLDLFGGDPITALTEVSALVALPSGPAPVRAAPLVIISADGVVSRVLDLTDAATLALLGTNEQEISGTWVKVACAPTQALAQAAYDFGGIAGICYPSAKHPDGVNLVVFPGRLAGSSSDYLEAYDPDGRLAQRLGS